MSIFDFFGGFPVCFNEQVREKEEALKKAQDEQHDLNQQLKENKRTIKELRRERDNLLSNKLENSSAYASTVVTEELDSLRTDVNAFKSRILELEARGKADKHQIVSLQIRLDQLVAAKAAGEKALMVSEAQNMQLKKRIAELEISKNNNVSGQRVAGTSNDRVPTPTPRSLEPSPTSVTTTSALSVQDTRDIENIKLVNKFLRTLADDTAFQEKLKKPTVQWAFVYWSGGDVSKIEHKADEIKKCEEVRSIYPVLDSFEAICIQSNIKIPLDLVAQGKAELDDDALIATFGLQFCESHRLLQAHKGKPGWFY